MKITTSKIEIRDLGKAWLVLSLAFAIVFTRDLVLSLLLKNFVIALITVGAGFILHELGHKFVAQYYGCTAEFRAFNQMLLLALVLSFFGLIFAAPGAVMIRGHLSLARNGKISLAGPLTNFILATLFFALAYFTTGFVFEIGRIGFLINTWLGLFNMIPVWNLDGKKIYNWDKTIYFIVVIVGFTFLFLGTSL
ncbi:MAG: hypothetical protein ABIF40_03880 [archaeon]